MQGAYPVELVGTSREARHRPRRRPASSTFASTALCRALTWMTTSASGTIPTTALRQAIQDFQAACALGGRQVIHALLVSQDRIVGLHKRTNLL